jgi:nicotinamide riboside kinase
MTKLVAIGGAQGTGKTYLARGVTNALNKGGTSADYVSEVAREWIGRFGIPVDVADQLDIFQLQLEREEAVLRNSSLDYLVVDSPLYLPYLYGMLASDVVEQKEQYRLQRLFSRVLKYSVRYSYNIVLMEPKHNNTDKIRVWDSRAERVITNGLLFFLEGLSLCNVHTVSAEKNFEERVEEVVTYIVNSEG